MWLARWSIRHPKAALAVCFAVTAAVAPGVLRLRLRTDGRALIPPESESIRVDHAIREEFAVYDPVVLFIETPHPDGVFNTKTLSLVQSLSDAVQLLPGIAADSVFSLATERGHRVVPGSLNFRRFLDPMPDSPEALKTLREDMRAIRLFNGTLIAEDERSTAVLAGVESTSHRLELMTSLDRLVRDHANGQDAVHVIGAPAAESLLGSHILEDLGVPSAILGSATRRPSDESTTGRGILAAGRKLSRSIGLVPLSMAVMFLVFLICFRSFTGAMLPLFEVGAGIVFVFGLMGWLNVPIYLTIAVLPVILTVIGVADEIHLFADYRRRRRAAPSLPPIETLTATMAEMSKPIVITSVTTAVGFLSFALSPLPPVQAFGIFTAIGVVFCMFWSLTAIPASLALLGGYGVGAARSTPSAEAVEKPIQPAEGVSRVPWFMRHPGLMVLLALIAVAVIPNGVRRVVVQDSWIEGFAEESAFRQAIERFNRQFLGMHGLWVRVARDGRSFQAPVTTEQLEPKSLRLAAPPGLDAPSLKGRRIRLTRPGEHENKHANSWESWVTGARVEGTDAVVEFAPTAGPPRMILRALPGEVLDLTMLDEPFIHPDTINLIEKFEDFVAAQRDDTVGGVLGPGDFLLTTHFMRNGLRESERRIPDSAERIAELWRQYERIRGAARRRQTVTANHDAALVTVFLKNANFVDVARLLEKMREYERQHLAPLGFRLQFGGDVAVSQSLIEAIVQTQVRSLTGSVFGAFLMMVLLGRSLKFALLCIIPCTLCVGANFAVMGWTGMPLGVATSMFAAMTLGIADDYAIHLVERFRGFRAAGLDRIGAAAAAIRTAGAAIILDAVAVGLGFGLLMLSQVPANVRLGGLVLLSLLGCMAATLILLPAVLILGAKRERIRESDPV